MTEGRHLLAICEKNGPEKKGVATMVIVTLFLSCTLTVGQAEWLCRLA